MPRPRDDIAREETAAEIKAIAHQQMADNGTAGISLRAIARSMGVTAPAIYNYFGSLDDLITALIVDAFNGLGDAVDTAVSQDGTPVHKFKAGTLAYREWALQHRADFQLIYGNPIPGYEAPAQLTVPLATRPLVTLYTLILAAWEAGTLTIPEDYQNIPDSVRQFMQKLIERDFPQISHAPIALFYLLHVGWTRIHGMVMLELFDHSPPSIGDPAAFYVYEVDVFLQSLALRMA